MEFLYFLNIVPPTLSFFFSFFFFNDDKERGRRDTSNLGKDSLAGVRGEVLASNASNISQLIAVGHPKESSKSVRSTRLTGCVVKRLQ